MTREKTFLVLGATVIAASFFASNDAHATILVGGSTLNGNFNADTSVTDSRPFSATPNWVNLGTGGDTEATRTNLPFDGSRNAVLIDDGSRIFGLDTGYNLADGDMFDLSYVWRDGFNWDDATDQVRVRLFVTGNDLIGGSRTNLVQVLSGLSTTNDAYQTFDQNAIYTATALYAGKRLFVDFTGVSGGGASTGFARLDNFVLEVTPTPEPSSFALFALALLGCVVCCRLRRR
jgi:hypothetical protein